MNMDRKLIEEQGISWETLIKELLRIFDSDSVNIEEVRIQS